MGFLAEKKSTAKKSTEKKGFGFGDMLGSLGQFEEYGKALVQFQADVLSALSRIEAEQTRAAEERNAIMAKLDHMVNRLDQQI